MKQKQFLMTKICNLLVEYSQYIQKIQNHQKFIKTEHKNKKNTTKKSNFHTTL